MKIAVNKCYGGFGISPTLLNKWNALYPNRAMEFLFEADYLRNDADFVRLVEAMGDEANAPASQIEIVEIPDYATDWMIDEYDGIERIIAVVDGKINFF